MISVDVNQGTSLQGSAHDISESILNSIVDKIISVSQDDEDICPITSSNVLSLSPDDLPPLSIKSSEFEVSRMVYEQFYKSSPTNQASPELSPQELLVSIEDLLIHGNRDEAINFCITYKQWPMALIISSICGASTYQYVVKQFLDQSVPEGSPLHTLSLIYSNQSSLLLKARPTSLLPTTILAPNYHNPSMNEASLQQQLQLHQQEEIYRQKSISYQWKRNLAAILTNKGRYQYYHCIHSYLSISLSIHLFICLGIDWETIASSLGDKLAHDHFDIMAAHVTYLCCRHLPNYNPLLSTTLTRTQGSYGKLSELENSSGTLTRSNSIPRIRAGSGGNASNTSTTSTTAGVALSTSNSSNNIKEKGLTDSNKSKLKPKFQLLGLLSYTTISTDIPGRLIYHLTPYSRNMTDCYSISALRMTEILEWSLNVGYQLYTATISSQQSSTAVNPSSSGNTSISLFGKSFSGFFGFSSDKSSNNNSSSEVTGEASSSSNSYSNGNPNGNPNEYSYLHNYDIFKEYSFISLDQLMKLRHYLCPIKLRLAYTLNDYGFNQEALAYASYVKDTVSTQTLTPANTFSERFLKDLDEFIDRLLVVTGDATRFYLLNILTRLISLNFR